MGVSLGDRSRGLSPSIALWMGLLAGVIALESAPTSADGPPAPTPSPSRNAYLMAVDRYMTLARNNPSAEGVAEMNQIFQTLESLMTTEDRYMQAIDLFQIFAEKNVHNQLTADDARRWGELQQALPNLARQASVRVCDRDGNPRPDAPPISVSEAQRRNMIIVRDPTRGPGIWGMPGHEAIVRRYMRLTNERDRLRTTANHYVARADSTRYDSPEVQALNAELARLEQVMQIRVFSRSNPQLRLSYNEVSRCDRERDPSTNEYIVLRTAADANAYHQDLEAQRLRQIVRDCVQRLQTPPVNMPSRTASIPVLQIGGTVGPWLVGTQPYRLAPNKQTGEIELSTQLHIRYAPPLDNGNGPDPRAVMLQKMHDHMTELLQRHGIRLKLTFTFGESNPNPSTSREVTVRHQGARGTTFNYVNWALALNGEPLGEDAATTWTHEFLHLLGFPEDYAIAGAPDTAVGPTDSIMRRSHGLEQMHAEGLEPTLSEQHLRWLIGPYCEPQLQPPGGPSSETFATYLAPSYRPPQFAALANERAIQGHEEELASVVEWAKSGGEMVTSGVLKTGMLMFTPLIQAYRRGASGSK